MADRYLRNKKLISDEDQQKLKGFTAAVIGLGGLGGNIAEQLSRIGIGRLILIDCDKVDESNLNRQLFATEKSIGQIKIDAAKERLIAVNSEVEYIFHNIRLDESNGKDILSTADIVVDAVDNIPTRFLMQKICKGLNKPLVHGSIGGWYGQVSFIMPGDDTLHKIYPEELTVGVEKKLGNPAFTPALVASIEVCEVIKYLLQKGELLQKKMLFIDLLTHDYRVIDI